MVSCIWFLASSARPRALSDPISFDHRGGKREAWGRGIRRGLKQKSSNSLPGQGRSQWWDHQAQRVQIDQLPWGWVGGKEGRKGG